MRIHILNKLQFIAPADEFYETIDEETGEKITVINEAAVDMSISDIELVTVHKTHYFDITNKKVVPKSELL